MKKSNIEEPSVLHQEAENECLDDEQLDEVSGGLLIGPVMSVNLSPVNVHATDNMNASSDSQSQTSRKNGLLTFEKY